MIDVPIVRISQVTDDRWDQLTRPPWSLSEKEILDNQISIEEVLENACTFGTLQSGESAENTEFS